MELNPFPTVVMLLYFVLVLGIGFWTRGRISTDISYYLADRGLGPVFAGFGRFATVSSAFTFVGALGLGYAFGFPFLMSITFGLIVGFLMVQLLLSPIRNSDAVSIADFLAARYTSPAIRLISSIIALLVMLPHIVAQLLGAGVISEAVIGMPRGWAMVIVAVVFTAYVVMGGLWAISWTDAFQGILLAIFMVIPAAFVIAEFGGDLTNAALAGREGFLTARLPVSSHVGVFVVFMGSLMTFPAFLFWSFTTTSAYVMRRSLLVAIVLGLIVYGTYYSVLGGAYALAPDLDNPDAAYFALLTALVGGQAVLLGLAAAAAMSAIMSSTDGMLLAAASIVSRDIYDVARPGASPDRLLNYGRLASVLLAAAALVFAFYTPALVGELTAAAAGAGGSAFVMPMVLGVWWRRMTKVGAIAGLVGGFLLFYALFFFSDLPAQTPVLISMPTSLVLCVLGSLFSAPPTDANIRFVDRMHERAVREMAR